jgi:hypothetical protein
MIKLNIEIKAGPLVLQSQIQPTLLFKTVLVLSFYEIIVSTHLFETGLIDRPCFS